MSEYKPLEDPKKESERDKARREFREYQSERLVSDMADVCRMPQGRRVMGWLLAMAGVYRSSMAAGNEIYFNEGRRSIGLALIEKLKAVTPALVMQIEAEKYSEESSQKAQIDKI